MASLKNILESHQGDGLPNILAIGTANPPNCFYQADYPNFYFQVTKNNHMSELKDKFKRICEKSSIRKRYLYLNDEIINDNPNLMVHKAPSLDARLDVVATQIPKLGKEAALKAIAEWRQPISNITHLIFCSSTDIVMPGLDLQLAKLMGLKPCVQKFMIYQQGCSAAGTAFRLAKDLARNNASARVLIVCCELIVVCFHPPSETRLDQLVGSALFADGAAAVIVGSNPNTSEHPLFQIVSANQTIIPDSENMLGGQLREMGVDYYMSKDLPKCVADNIQQCYAEAVSPVGITDSNKLFYIVHPGGPAILKAVEQKLGLTKDKLKATWQVLSEYGNMRSPSVLFILDEMRKTSMLEGKATTGEGLEWGILFAFGPGVTVETVVLRSCATVN